MKSLSGQKKSPAEAGDIFAMQTLLRSERHGLVLGGFFGLGIVTASQYLFASLRGRPIEAGSFPSSEIFAIPLILSYCLILGVPFVFDIPNEMGRTGFSEFLSIKPGTNAFLLHAN